MIKGMPSPRKRIGFLPRPVIQELIREIANKEKLSQSRVVGVLVEEALLARGIITPYISDDIKIKTAFDINKKTNNASYIYNYNDINELISDKGVTYNKSRMNTKERNIQKDLTIEEEKYNAELMKKFKEFLYLQKMQESDRT